MTTGPAPDATPSSGRPVWSLTGDDILAELDNLHAEMCRIQTRRLALLAGLEALGYAKDIGARGTADLLARRHHLDHQSVHRDLKLATTLPKYPTVQQALDDGGLYVKQAEVIVTSLEQAPNAVPVDNLHVAESEMVKAAQTLPPSDLRRLGRHVADRLDPDGREPTEDTAHALQRLHLSRTYTGHGIRFRGFLANENAELFQTLIDRCSKPRKITTPEHPNGILDPRSKSQRQADALTHILHTAASTTPGTASSGTIIGTTGAATPARPPRVKDTGTPNTAIRRGPHNVGETTDGTGTAATAADASAADASAAGASAAGASAAGASAADATGAGADTGGSHLPAELPGLAELAGPAEPIIGLPAHGGIRPHIMVTIGLTELIEAGRQHTGDLLFGDRLSASAVRMLACDAGIIPIVLSSNSEPLDVGREFRSVTPAIRTALIARDKGCVVCGAPPAWCDAHHIVHWADGGATSVDNAVLICKPDHRDTHKGIWTIQITNGVVQVTGPHYKPSQHSQHPLPTPSRTNTPSNPRPPPPLN